MKFIFCCQCDQRSVGGACLFSYARRAVRRRAHCEEQRSEAARGAPGTSPPERGHSPKHTDFSGKNNKSRSQNSAKRRVCRSLALIASSATLYTFHNFCSSLVVVSRSGGPVEARRGTAASGVTRSRLARGRMQPLTSTFFLRTSRRRVRSG